MNAPRRLRPAVLAALALSVQACASAPNVFERHDTAMATRAAMETGVEPAMCPVLVANDTDFHLGVEYEVGGLTSDLGYVPAGQKLSFGVFCEEGSVRATGKALEGRFMGDGPAYYTSARLDPVTPAVLHFTEASASTGVPR